MPQGLCQKELFFGKEELLPVTEKATENIDSYSHRWKDSCSGAFLALFDFVDKKITSNCSSMDICEQGIMKEGRNTKI